MIGTHWLIDNGRFVHLDGNSIYMWGRGDVCSYAGW